MADTPISGLPAAGAANLTDEFAVNQAGTTRKVTGTQVQTALVTPPLTAHIASSPATHAVGSITASLIADRTRKFYVEPYTAHNRDAVTWDYMGQSTMYIGLGIDVIDNEYVTMSGRFMVPEDFVGSMTATPVWCMEQGAAGSPRDLYIETVADSGTCDEDFSTHTETLAFVAYSIIVPQAPESPVYRCSTALSIALATKGDLVLLATTRDSTVASGGLDTVNDRCCFIGWIVSYTADS